MVVMVPWDGQVLVHTTETML